MILGNGCTPVTSRLIGNPDNKETAEIRNLKLKHCMILGITLCNTDHIR